MDCALARIARGRQVKTVCEVLGVARSKVIERVKRPADWSDGRKNRRPADDEMLEAIEYRFGMLQAPTPIQWLSDNGSPYIAGDTRRFARELGLMPLTTPIESPQSDGMAEAFVNTLKRDCVSVNPTPKARTILESLSRWIERYNEPHPHSSLRVRSPRMFRREQASVE